MAYGDVHITGYWGGSLCGNAGPVTTRRLCQDCVWAEEEIKRRDDSLTARTATKNGEQIQASLSTIPGRESSLENVVNRILPQVDVLRVYLDGFDRVPPFLERSNVVVARSQNHGLHGTPAKFFWADGADGYQILIDDDIDYPNNYVSQMVRAIDRYERRAIVGVHGLWFSADAAHLGIARAAHFAEKLSSDTRVMGLGTGTAAYHAKHVQVSRDDFPLPRLADLQFAAGAQRRQTPMIAVARSAGWLRPIATSGPTHWDRRAEMNTEALAIVQATSWDEKSTAVTPAKATEHGDVARRKPRVCLVSDVRRWAFDQNMHDMAEYLSDEFEFGHFYVEDRRVNLDWRDFDLVYECFHRNPDLSIPPEKWLGSLRSQWWDPAKHGPLAPEQVAAINRRRAFHTTTRAAYEDALAAGCKNVFYLTNPVNVRRFQDAAPLRDQIVAEWNGNAGHANATGTRIKHFWDIVVPACEQAKVALIAAEYGTTTGSYRRRAPAEMPGFYKQANVALCASEYEAASFSVMEAMCSGLAVVATDVGNHREMRDSQLDHFGDSGILLVDRVVGAFAQALREISPRRAHEMGAINRAEIMTRWSWDAWGDRFRQFFRRGL